MKALLLFGISVLFGMLMVALLSGCQVDVSGAVGGKVFYPDKAGGKDKDVGDPRKGMYVGFRGMEGGGK